MNKPMNLTLLRPVGALNLLVLLIAVAVVSPALAQSREITPPDLDALDAQGKELLGNALDYFESVREGLAGRELGLQYGRLALHLMAQQQFASATDALRHAQELDAGNFRWPYLLGLTQTFAGNLEGAVALYGQALRRQPKNGVVATRLGLALIDAGKPASARSILNAPASSDTPMAAAVAGLGRIALEGEEYETAITQYERALELDPDATQLYAALANAHRALGNDAQAQVAESKAGDGLPAFNDPIIALLEAHRQPSSEFITLGDKARDAGAPGQAAVFYDFAVAVNPRDTVAAQRLASLRETTAAKRAANAPEPTTASDFFERGVFFAANDQDERAIADFEQSLGADADNVATRVFLANALMRQKRFADAAVQYGTASARDDQNSELRYRQGLAWLAAGRCQRAETALLAGYELDPAALRIVQAISRLFATCEVDDDKRQVALKYAERLYSVAPSLETSETLAMVLAALGRFDDAADYQRQAIFEALKAGRNVEDSPLSTNLNRYVEKQPASEAWPADHPIFRPPPPSSGGRAPE
ncbi:MAG: tetratricopeptide repeat protein [Pseudomonadota bacterium]